MTFQTKFRRASLHLHAYGPGPAGLDGHDRQQRQRHGDPRPRSSGRHVPDPDIAQSTTNPDLVAQSVVNVTITPTQPGITLAVQPDTLLTVPFQGAQLPTAFQAVIHNNGPAAETYNLSFSNIPSGFTLLNSGTTVTIPAGQTGIVGIYLLPTTGQPIPASGYSPFVRHREQHDRPGDHEDAGRVLHRARNGRRGGDRHLRPPEQHSRHPVTATITLQDVGNVPENVSLAATCRRA